jgi:hypothetical protein
MANTPTKRARQMPVDEEAIERVAEEVTGVPFASKADTAKEKVFKEFFGCRPIVVARAWELIQQYTTHDAPDAFSIKHLLWGLFFLKAYTVEGIRSSVAASGTRSGIRPDVKTVRDWTWIALDCLAKIEPYVVSIVFIEFCCSVHCIIAAG